MLHIVLFLLKIIGILLVSILGLLLMLVLIVLFVPIRYKIWGEYREDIKARVKVTWLLRIISFQISYANENLSIKLRIFGKIFFDNKNPRNKKPKSVKKNRSKKDKNIRKNNPKSNVSQKNAVKEVAKKEIIIDTTDNLQTFKSDIEVKEIVTNDNELKDTGTKEIQTKATEIKRVEIKEIIEKETHIAGENTPLDDNAPLVVDLEVNQEKKRSIFQKMKEFLQKIKDFCLSIKMRFDKFKNTFSSVGDTLANVRAKWNLIKAFYSLDSNKQGIKQSFYAVKKIVRHVLPRKLKGEIEFGTGDPCSTGQALGVAAGFYGFYKNSIQIIPNFNEAMFQGNIYAVGRIRIVTLLIIVVKLILNKNFKGLIKNFRVLKEEL